MGNFFCARLLAAACLVAAIATICAAQELVPVNGRPQGPSLGFPASIRNVGAVPPALSGTQPAFQPQQVMPALRGAAQNQSFASPAQPPTRMPQSPDPYANPSNLPVQQNNLVQPPASRGAAEKFAPLPPDFAQPAADFPAFQNLPPANASQPWRVPNHLPPPNLNAFANSAPGQMRNQPEVPLFVPPTGIPTFHPEAAGPNQQTLDLNGLLSSELPPSEAGQGIETILQRFPDGKVEIARQVKQDEAGNYVNHGVWKQLQQNGQLISAGTYQMGKRHGEWYQWHFSETNPALQLSPYNDFKGPFLSKGIFREDQLDGVWLILDRFQRTVSEIHFKAGKRQGVASWYFANGMKRREITYRDGLMDGLFRQWDDKQKLTRQVNFQEGRPLLVETEFYDRKKGLKQSEQQFLGGMIVERTPDNWPAMEVATYAVEGDKVKHGPVTVWYPNGQLRMKGQYDHDMMSGQFMWWHENGQKQLAGDYRGGQQTGNWVWWHENGMKSTQGNYDNDRIEGQWTWWDKAGSVTRRDDFSENRIVETEETRVEEPEATQKESLADEQGLPPLRASTISNIKD